MYVEILQYQAHTSLRGWSLSASRGSNMGPPETPRTLWQYGTERGSRGGLIWTPITPRGGSLTDTLGKMLQSARGAAGREQSSQCALSGDFRKGPRSLGHCVRCAATNLVMNCTAAIFLLCYPRCWRLSATWAPNPGPPSTPRYTTLMWSSRGFRRPWIGPTWCREVRFFRAVVCPIVKKFPINCWITR